MCWPGLGTSITRYANAKHIDKYIYANAHVNVIMAETVFFWNDMETAAYTFTFTFLSINWKFSFSLFFFIIIIYNLYSSPKNFQNELWWLFDMFVCLFSMLYAGYNIEWYTHRHIYTINTSWISASARPLIFHDDSTDECSSVHTAHSFDRQMTKP